jgi:hypothetical protein
MGGLREFRVILEGAKDAPERPISILARTPLIALYQGATIALGFNAADFDLQPGKWIAREQ